MHIDDAIYNAKHDNCWIKPFDTGRRECIVRFTSADPNKLVEDETSFDLNAETAEEELKELWEDQWKKDLNAKSYESVSLVYIKRGA